MKALMLIPLLAMSSVALGQAVQSEIPSFERVWALFLAVDSNEQQEPGAGRGLLLRTGMTEKGADVLFRYIRQSVEQVNARTKVVIEETCRDKAFLEVSPIALADRLEVDDAAHHSFRKGLADGFAAGLSSDDGAKVRQWVERNLRLSMGPDIKASDLVRRGTLPAEKAMAKACGAKDS